MVWNGSYPASAGVTQYLAYSGLGGSDATAVTSQSALVNLDKFSFGTGFQRLSLNINRSELVDKKPLKWWRTTSRGSAPYDEEVQGALYYAVDLDMALDPGIYQTTVIAGTCEFCNPILSADQLSVPKGMQLTVVPRKPLKAPEADQKSDSEVVV